jgi:uncharacterized protein YbjT (DUF2867 family)
MYVITGVTGHVGSAAAEALLSRGKQVRAVVRDAKKGEPWKARGAEVAVVADLNDRGAVAGALAGAEGAFLLLPPNLGAEDPIATSHALADTLAHAAADARVPHVVFLSSVGAQHETGTGPIRMVHQGEVSLREVGLQLTAIRAAYFMENHAGALAGIAGGVFPTFGPPDVAFPQVATRDIGAQVAQSLVEGGNGFRVVEMKGPRDYSAADVAAALSAIVGKPLAVVQHPTSAVEPTFIGFGCSPKMAALYREMFEGIASGRVAYDGAGKEVRGGTPIEDVLRKLVGPQAGSG